MLQTKHPLFKLSRVYRSSACSQKATAALLFLSASYSCIARADFPPRPLQDDVTSGIGMLPSARSLRRHLGPGRGDDGGTSFYERHRGENQRQRWPSPQSVEAHVRADDRRDGWSVCRFIFSSFHILSSLSFYSPRGTQISLFLCPVKVFCFFHPIFMGTLPFLGYF